MPRIAIASQNPVKARAILSAFERLFADLEFQVLTHAAPSGVADQPRSDDETRRGALNRLRAVQQALPDCDYWAAIEGGIEERPEGMHGLAWIAIRSRRLTGQARTATFPLPPPLAKLVRQGIELGVACDQLYDKENTKHGEGAIGLLSHQIIDRHQLYVHGAIMALLPLKNEAWYAETTEARLDHNA